MKIDTKSKNFKNVLAKAKKNKPFVSIVSGFDGTYRVEASGLGFYIVSFWSENNEKHCSCECLGFERGFFCYHIAAALLAHSSFVRAGLRRSALSF